MKPVTVKMPAKLYRAARGIARRGTMTRGKMTFARLVRTLLEELVDVDRAQCPPK